VRLIVTLSFIFILSFHFSKAQYVEIGYPIGLSETKGKINTGIGYIYHIRNFINFDFKGTYSIYEYSGYELRNYCLTAGYVRYFRPFNLSKKTYRRMTAAVGYGMLDNSVLDKTNGINFHISYTLMWDGKVSPMLTLSYDNYQYGKTTLDNQEFNAQMSFISINIGFRFH